MTRHRLILAAAFAAAVFVPSASQAAGALIKGSSSAVYYLDAGRRWVFPNERVYFSWYAGFDGVRVVSDAEMASYPLGGNVTYRPGVKLVKLQSDPRVHAVDAGGRLRWIASEAAAAALYGPNWNRQVDDVADTLFLDYKEGEPIAAAADFDRAAALAVAGISEDVAARSGAVRPTGSVAKASGLWSDPATWGGALPGAGAQVSIPAGLKVTFDLADAPSFASVDILGSLEFSTSRSTRLSARRISVRGTLAVGTPAAPLPLGRTAEIVLTGASASAFADDALTVDGGTLSLHGVSVGSAWTTLAKPAAKDGTRLELSAPAAWPIGSEVAVLGASSADAAEVRTVTAVDGATLTLDAPLASNHRAEAGLASEVLLLGRNVTVRGAGEGLGSGVIAINRATVDVSNVAFEKLGRKGAEGRYPLFLDGLTAPRVRGSLIRSSGNRCVSLRQVTGAQVEGNVAFGAYGHCFMTEDGAETGNAFTGNLAADVRPGALPGDALPAGFLLRHPGNALRGNAVVGSAGYGYWYLLPEDARRNGGAALKPREAEFGAFEDNAVRAAAKVGLYVDDAQGRMDYAPPSTAVFSGLSAVMNGERGFWMRGAGLEVRDAYLAENPIGGTFAAFGAALKESVVEARLPGSAASAAERVGFTYLDGPVALSDVTFRRFAGASAALGFERDVPRVPDPRNSFRRVAFEGSRPWRIAEPVTPGDAMSLVRDLDAGEAIVAPSGFLGDCPVDAHGVTRCEAAYAQLSIALRDGAGDRDVAFHNLETGVAVTLHPGTATFDGDYAYANVREGGSYAVEVPNVPSVRLDYDGRTEPLLVRLPAGLGPSVRSGGAPLPKKELAALEPGGWAYDAAEAEAVLWLRPGDSFELLR